MLLKSKHVVRLGRRLEERVARLAIPGTQTREERRQAQGGGERSTSSFRSGRSSPARRAKGADAAARAGLEPAGVEVRAAMEAAAREAFAAQHTFEPNVDAKARGRRAASVPGELLRVRRHHQPHPRVPPREGVVLQEARNEKEFRELERTFQPNSRCDRNRNRSPRSARPSRRWCPGWAAPRAAEARETDGGRGAAEGGQGFWRAPPRRDIAHRQTVPRSPKISAQLGGRQGGGEAQKAPGGEGRRGKRRTARSDPRRTNDLRKELIEKLLAEDDDDYNSPLGREL